MENEDINTKTFPKKFVAIFVVLLLSLFVMNFVFLSKKGLPKDKTTNINYSYQPKENLDKQETTPPSPTSSINITEIRIKWAYDVTVMHGPWMLGSVKCPITCTYYFGRTNFEVDAYIFNVFLHGFIYETSVPDNTPRVGFTMEMFSEKLYNLAREKFDLLMTYRLDSDVVAGYFSAKVNQHMAPPLSWEEKTINITWICSNCAPDNDRNEKVRSLMQHLHVNSYGLCINTEGLIGHSDRDKLDLYRKSKFVLTFENSNSKDYVSEKFFDALAMGAVPVYFGAPNIRDFLPHEKSAIVVDEFDDMESVAVKLKYLLENKNEYEKYLEWKNIGASQQFLDMISQVKLDSKCRLCIKVKEWKEKNQ